MTTDKVRYMYYMLYTKPWFNDNINFSNVSIFNDNNSMDSGSNGDDNDCRSKNENLNSEGYCDMDDM
jgi:hypothetical protein